MRRIRNSQAIFAYLPTSCQPGTTARSPRVDSDLEQARPAPSRRGRAGGRLDAWRARRWRDGPSQLAVWPVARTREDRCAGSGFQSFVFNYQFDWSFINLD
jgi:hypothetical protein